MTDSFLCSVCGKQFGIKHELTLHNITQCDTTKQFHCKSLTSASSLYNHIMLQDNGEPLNPKLELLKQEDLQVEIKQEESQNKLLLQHHSVEEFVNNENNEDIVRMGGIICDSFNEIEPTEDPLKLESVSENNIEDNEEMSSSSDMENTDESNIDDCIDNEESVKNETTADLVKIETVNCNKNPVQNTILCLSSDDEDNDSDDIMKESKNQIKKPLKKEYIREKHKAEILKFKRDTHFDKKGYGDCRHCGRRYRNLHWLYKHVKDHENADKCKYSEMRFSNKKELLTHQPINHIDALTCCDCDKVFANRDSLRVHRKQFHQCERRPSYECDVCKKHFANKYSRNNHMRVHDSKKTIFCKFCNKSFHWKSQLKIHERSHTGEKPFACPNCPKTFAYKESLTTHSTTHTGIKPHVCESCNSRFSCIGNLIKHRKSHRECGSWVYQSRKPPQEDADVT